MPRRKIVFVNQGFYHIFNRGVNKQAIFSEPGDYDRLLEILDYYQFDGPKSQFSTKSRFKLKGQKAHPKIVEIICYCLMPNHFHLLVRQLREEGVKEFVTKVASSYSHYYNEKHDRVGPLFQGVFKATTVESDEQLLHLSRYIHLNPYVGGLTKDLDSFNYSSYKEFMAPAGGGLSAPKTILDFFKSSGEYRRFVNDQKDYAQQLDLVKHLAIDP